MTPFDAILVMVGSSLALAGVWVLHRVRTRTGALFGISGVVICPSVVFWSPSNCLAFENIVHMPGAGALCGHLGSNGFIILQSAWAATTLTGRLPLHHRGRYRAAFILNGASLALVVVTWLIARDVTGSRAAPILDHGFHGRPTGVLLWTVASGFSTTGASGLCLYLLRLLWRQTGQARWLLFAVGNGALIVYGLAMVVQALLDRWGLAALPIEVGDWNPMSAVWIVLDVLCIGAACWMIFAAAQRRRPPRLLRLLVLFVRARRLRPLLRDLVALLMLLSDRLVNLRAHTTPALVQRVVDRCVAHGIPPLQRRIAVEAARWITSRRAILARQPWPEVDDGRARRTDGTIVANAARFVKRGTFVYADICYVVILTLGRERVPAWLGPLPEPRTWQRRLAVLVADALDECASATCGHPGASMGATLSLRENEGTRAGSGWRTSVRKAWRDTCATLSLDALERASARVFDDLVMLSMLCVDRMVYVQEHADATVVQAVAQKCRARGLPPERCCVALEAARWACFFLPHAADRETAGRLSPAEWDAVPTPVGGLDQDREPIHYADVCRVVLLVLRRLAPSHIPIGVAARHELPGWRRDVAELIAAALPPRAS